LPGERLGMRDGVILVRGRAGSDVGRRMRRGLIAVAGSAGDAFGAGMIAGTVVAYGPVGLDTGVGMKRGSIVLGQEESPRLPVTFESAGRFRFPFLAVYFRHLATLGFPVPRGVSEGEFLRYNGDLASGGQGEILTTADAAEG
jgi:formylmethanofuran dehydrogenase subunit C